MKSAIQSWRSKRERYNLEGAQCEHCGKQYLASRLTCPYCHREIEQIAREVFPTLEVEESPQVNGQSQISVTVLIPAYNAASTIQATLSSLLAQDFKEPYEIIVVDSSSDETPHIIAEQSSEVRLIRRDQQTDPGTARNLGIAQAQGEIIACIDADCIAQPDWLRRMVEEQRSGLLPPFDFHTLRGLPHQVLSPGGSALPLAAFTAQCAHLVRTRHPCSPHTSRHLAHL